jgi:hypothetical protein
MCPSLSVYSSNAEHMTFCSHLCRTIETDATRGSGWESVLEIAHVQSPLDLNVSSSRWSHGRTLCEFEPRIV